MSQHSSFKSGGSASSKKRSVLKRFERIDLLRKRGADLRILLSHSAFLSIFLRTYLGAGCHLFESPYLRAVLRKKSPNCKNRQSKKYFGTS